MTIIIVVVKGYKKNTKLGMSGLDGRSIENCASDKDLTNLTNGICTNQNLS